MTCIRRNHTLLTVLALATLTCLVAALPAQQTYDPLDHYTWHPGGTPEAELWQIIILFGVGETTPTAWDGALEVTSGEVQHLQGYRFEPPDRALGLDRWRVHTRVERIYPRAGLSGHGPSVTDQQVLPKGILVRGQGTSGTRLTIETAHGRFTVLPMQLAFGDWRSELQGRAAIQRIPPVTDLSGTEQRQHDFPSIAADADGALWTTWSSYHDRREELNFRRYKDGQWTRLIPVGRAAEDLWRPHITTDAAGKPWLIWSQRPSDDGPGNWDIYAMAWEDNEWGPKHRLTDNPLPDIEPHIARSPNGTVYVVWQSLSGSYSQIRLKYLRDGKWSETVSVTNTKANNWEPAVAAGPDNRAWIAWDRYDGNYDVYARAFSPDDGLSPEHKVASTERYEAHVSVAVDNNSRPWIAWETGGVNWGKDLGAFLGTDAPGSPLGDARDVEIVCLDGGVWKAPAGLDFSDPLSKGATSTSRPTLYFDSDNNLWLSFKRRFSRRTFRPSIFWEYYLTRLDGDRWTDPVVLPQSWSRKSTRMSMAAAQGRLWAFWPHENRDWEFSSRPHSNRVVAGSIELPGPGKAPKLSAYKPLPTVVRPVPPGEEADVRAIRSHRISLAGKPQQIVRGDLHRHTELSQDQGGMDDGSLPEFYRYMIDAAAMDFGASTDHQAGGTDYWNNVTQKLADMYHFPERFSTLYGYERNLGNPFGHRNMIYTHRDYPVVPFYQSIHPDFMLPDSPDGELLTFNSMSFGSGIRNDTKLLYDIVKETNGLAIPHTSGSSGMGTDWSDNDPEVDTVVEIYQGARLNYEHEGAPRGAGSDGRGLRGVQKPGEVWNAWKKGYRIGVIASSDHYSTHISYAMVYTPSTSREDIFNAIKKRHTYGATDNIVLEFWLGNHFMGDDFSASEKQNIRVRVRGTGTIAKVHLIRDGEYIHAVSPGKPEVEFQYIDNAVGSGEHWYYVRVEQENQELAWSSPIWVRYR